MTTIEERIVELKLAENVYSARHIVDGLRLNELESEEKQIERVRLYREWRDAGEKSKIAYYNAIEGRVPMKLIE